MITRTLKQYEEPDRRGRWWSAGLQFAWSLTDRFPFRQPNWSAAGGEL